MAGTGPRPVGTHTLTDTALPPGTQDGNSALHNAANEGHVAVVRLLLRAGATLELRNESGKTPLFEACSGGQAAVTLLLLEAGANVNASDEVRARGRALLPVSQLIHAPLGPHASLVRRPCSRRPRRGRWTSCACCWPSQASWWTLSTTCVPV